MSDITPLLAELLKKHDARLNASRRRASETEDTFLREAYRIVCPTRSHPFFLPSPRVPKCPNLSIPYFSISTTERPYILPTQLPPLNPTSLPLQRPFPPPPPLQPKGSQYHYYPHKPPTRPNRHRNQIPPLHPCRINSATSHRRASTARYRTRNPTAETRRRITAMGERGYGRPDTRAG